MEASLKALYQYRPSTKSSNTSSLLSVLSLWPCLKVFLSQSPSPLLIQLERWKNKTIWWDIFKLAKPWEELITSVLIRLVLWLKIWWQSLRYSLKRESMRPLLGRSWATTHASYFLLAFATTQVPILSSCQRGILHWESNKLETKLNVHFLKLLIGWVMTMKNSETEIE